MIEKKFLLSLPLLAMHGATAATGQTAPTLSATVDAVASATKGKFARIAPQKVAESPNRWVRQPLEFSEIGVYWVAGSDVRFLTGAGVAIFTKAVQGTKADLEHFRTRCSSAANAITEICSASIRFSFDNFVADDPVGIRPRTVLNTKLVAIRR